MTALSQVSFRFFHFDPTFAPPDKTAVTCFLPTRHDRFWTELQLSRPDAYHSEKARVQSAVGEAAWKAGSSRQGRITGPWPIHSQVSIASSWRGIGCFQAADSRQVS